MKNDKNILKKLTEIKNKRFRGRERTLFEFEIEEIKKELDLLILYSFQDLNLNVFNYNKLLEDYKSVRNNKKRYFLFSIELEEFKELDYIEIINYKKDEFTNYYNKLKKSLIKNEGFIGIYMVGNDLVLLIEDENNSKKVTNVMKNMVKKEKVKIKFFYHELTKKISGVNKTLTVNLNKNKMKLKEEIK